MLNFYNLRQDFLKFEGSDRLDLINRLSTNQVNNLQRFKGIKTVLTSDKGRFVDLLTLFNFGDFVFASCSFNNSKNVMSHLEKYTIMDDFTATDLAGSHETMLFFGDGTAEFASNVFGADINAFANNDFNVYVKDDCHSIIAASDDNLVGFYFIYATKDHAYWHDMILSDELRKQYSLAEIDDKIYNELRINKGLPVYPNEMNDRTNPLECGLNKYVSFTKGCYIGQEVIARLDTYDKISKHLVKVKLNGELTAGGAKILLEGRECGNITSASGGLALGFVKTIFLDFNKKYTVSDNGTTIDCELQQINYI